MMCFEGGDGCDGFPMADLNKQLGESNSINIQNRGVRIVIGIQFDGVATQIMWLLVLM